MQTNLNIVIRNMKAKGGNKPTHKTGGAKRRDWSFNPKHERRNTGKCVTIYPAT